MKKTYRRRRPKPLTAEALYKMTDRIDGTWHELDGGALAVCEPSGFEHSGLGVKLIIRLGAYIEEHALGQLAGADGGYVLTRNPDTVRAPDVSFVRAERVPKGRLTSRFFEGAPDLAVEIVSPNDNFLDVERKVRQYLDAGTQLVWVLRPIDQSAIVYRADGTTNEVLSHQALDGETVVPGFQIPLSSIFSR